MLLAAVATAVLSGSLIPTAGHAIAPPVPECNTPDPSNGIGIMLHPANTDGSGHQLLTKSGLGFDTAGNAYQFKVVSTEPPNATFSQFTDCAYSVINGNPAMPGYNENESTSLFTFDSSCNCWVATFVQTVNTVNGQPDSICDRAQVKGTVGNTPFTDYSNVVLSTPGSQTAFPGAAPSCSPSSDVPDVPFAALVLVVGAAVIGGMLVWRRRRGRPADPA